MLKQSIKLILLALLFVAKIAFAQSTFETTFESQMIEYEHDVVRTYNELQKFLFDSTPNAAEQTAFENLLSIYVDRILEIYNTMQRMTGSTLETYRGVTARALIFRSLTYLEQSHESKAYYEKAIEDYKRALQLYQTGKNIPIMNKKLPYEVWIGRKMYTRLADLLDDKGKDFDLLDSFR